MSKIPVTVILPVKDDAEEVAKSLARLTRFQKIVVIDSDSKDGTDRVAAEYGAEYVIFNWNGKPPKKRTWYLNNHEIETDWVLFLDADELVNDAFCDEVERATASGKYVGFWMSFQNWFMEKWLRHGDPFSKLALFRHDAGRYEQVADARWTSIDVEVHEHPILDGPVGKIHASVAHDERRGMDSYIGKHNDYSTWEANRYVALEPRGDGVWNSLTRRQQFKYRYVDKWWFATTYFIHAFVLKKGFLDGRAGFVFASLKREYYSHIRLKILEIRNKAAIEATHPSPAEPSTISNQSKDIPVTLIVPVKNEARNLASCLERLGRFQELVVIDSGSTDGTIDIARSHGATCIQFEWNGHFPKKRNWYLDNHEIKTDWVLFLDADELINDAFCEEVQQAVASGNHTGYWLNFHNWFQGKYLRHGDPFSKLALFRPDAGRYKRVDDEQWSGLDMEIHEHPVLDGTIGHIEAPIDHNDRRGLDSYIKKHNEYSTWEARQHIAIGPKSGQTWQALTSRQRFKYKHIEKWWFKWVYFFLAFILKLGILDGRAGFVFASLKRQYYGHIRLKLREIRDMAKQESGTPLS